MISDMLRPENRAGLPQAPPTTLDRHLARLTNTRAALYAALAGTGLLWTLFTWSEAFSEPPWSILSTAVPLGTILGLVVVFAGGWLLAGIGSRLGGDASAEDVRAAVGWSALGLLPSLLLPPLLAVGMAITYLVNTPELLKYRFLVNDRIVSPASYFHFHATVDGASAGLLPLLLVALGLLLLCSTLMLIMAYARVNSFSPWRAAAVVLLAPLAGLLLLIVGLVGLFITVMF